MVCNMTSGKARKTAGYAGQTRGQLLEELAQLRARVEKFECATCPSSVDSGEHFFKNILETVRDGIWVADPRDNIIYANKAMADIAGIPVTQITGRSVLSGFPEKTLKNFRSFYRQARKNLQPLQYEALVVTLANRETWQAGWLIPD